MAKCTILIPTYNRPNRLRRILDYYNKYGKDFNIIIADSSSDNNKKINKKIISKFSKLDFLYIDKYSPTNLMYHKLLDTINRVKTKYSVLCADDDFITPNGINKSVNFLEKNQDFTVAQGYYISFYLKNKNKFSWMLFPGHESITFPKAKSRVAFFLSNYHLLTLYGVHRTKGLQASLEEMFKFTDETIFYQILLTTLEVIYGKIKCLDLLYGVRELTLPPGVVAPNRDFMDFIKEGTYDKKYAKFRESISTHLSKKSKLTIEESKKLIDDNMSSCLKDAYKRRHGDSMVKIAKFLSTLGLPFWMHEKMRDLYRDLCFIQKVRMNPFWNSIDKPSSKYYDDFNKIRNHVLLHSKYTQKSSEVSIFQK